MRCCMVLREGHRREFTPPSLLSDGLNVAVWPSSHSRTALASAPQQPAPTWTFLGQVLHYPCPGRRVSAGAGGGHEFGQPMPHQRRTHRSTSRPSRRPRLDLSPAARAIPPSPTASPRGSRATPGTAPLSPTVTHPFRNASLAVPGCTLTRRRDEIREALLLLGSLSRVPHGEPRPGGSLSTRETRRVPSAHGGSPLVERLTPTTTTHRRGHGPSVHGRQARGERAGGEREPS